jgi:mycothiol synthase
MSVDASLPGYRTRDASLGDCEAIAGLINEVNIAEIGIPWTTADEIRDDLTTPGHQPGDDVLLVASDGSIAGYLTLWPDEPLTSIQQLAFVRPSLWGRGLSAWLLRDGEARARARIEPAQPVQPVSLHVARWAANAAAVPLFESLGYRPARIFHEMRIELGERPEEPEIPEGIVIRTFEVLDARAVYDALAEAFQDHWGTRFETFEVWKHDRIEGASSNFDPGLWFVAFDGDEVVGVACCRDHSARAPDAANVDELGVRRAWRGRGIGRSLLLHAFAEARRRGIGAVELFVDSESLTGATRLYEDVGMHPIRSVENWQKVLDLPAPGMRDPA